MLPPTEKPSENPKPRVNPESIYPTVDRSANKPSPTSSGPEHPAESIKSNFFSTFWSELAVFILGLCGMAILGLLLGATFNETLVSHSHQYFGGLADAISAIYILPILTFFFIIAAMVGSNWWLAFYPIVAFGWAQEFVDMDITKLLAGYVPASPPDGHPQYFEYMIAVMFSYVAVQAVAGPAHTLYKNRRRLFSKNKRVILVTNVSFLGIVFVLFGTVAIAGKPLYIGQQRTRAAVYIPSSDRFFGEPSNDFELHYGEATKQYDGTYQQADEVKVTPLKEWWNRDTPTVCGTNYVTTLYPGQKPANEYKKTPAGATYAQAIFDANGSQPAVKSQAYKEYRYCFVVGYQRYDLVRSDRVGTEYLSKYPAESVVDAFVSAKAYLPGCTETKQASYCQASDKANNQQLSKESQQKYRSPSSTGQTPIPGLKTPTTNPLAYKEIGRLTITEWGVSFALTDEIKDAYYVKSPNSKDGDTMAIGLRSYDNDLCFAGIRASPGRVLKGDGVASIRRHKLPDIKGDSNNYFSGVVVGDYAYGLTGSVNSCATSLGKDEAFKTSLNDVFDWSTVTIK
jgi:hypothetical protein